MTDFDPDRPALLDEAASAALDGERAPDGLDPRDATAVRARGTELDAVRALVAEPIAPPDTVTRDAMIARAVALGSAPSDSPGDVVPLDAARTAKTRRFGRLAPLATAAAVLVAAAVVIPGLLEDSRDQTVASAPPTDDPATADAADAATRQGSSTPDEGDTGDAEAPSSAGDVGTAQAEDQIEAAAEAAAAPTIGGDAAVGAVPTDEDLLAFATDPGGGGRILDRVPLDQLGCARSVDHRIDRTIRSDYAGEAAVFFVQLDDAVATVITVVNHNCLILARVEAG